MILFPWLARVFDRSDERSNASLPLTLSSSSQGQSHEIRSQAITYYQVLVDSRDALHIRAQTGEIFKMIFEYQLSCIYFRICYISGESRT